MNQSHLTCITVTAKFNGRNTCTKEECFRGKILQESSGTITKHIECIDRSALEYIQQINLITTLINYL